MTLHYFYSEAQFITKTIVCSFRDFLENSLEVPEITNLKYRLQKPFTVYRKPI